MLRKEGIFEASRSPKEALLLVIHVDNWLLLYNPSRRFLVNPRVDVEVEVDIFSLSSSIHRDVSIVGLVVILSSVLSITTTSSTFSCFLLVFFLLFLVLFIIVSFCWILLLTDDRFSTANSNCITCLRNPWAIGSIQKYIHI